MQGCLVTAHDILGEKPIRRTHVAVVEGGDGGEPRLRGIFSSAKLMRLTRSAARSRRA